jgi:predicted flap endonuclease-1-like 5' DNA nuclease
MNVIALFVLGLLFGWLAEWAIDWYYWRPRIRGIADENTGLKERIALLETKKTPVRVSSKNLPLIDANGNHNFQAIKGVGPVFARRLKGAGIVTFDELSKLKTEQLEEILGKLYKRFFSRQETIQAQAKEFAKQVAEKN